MSGPQIWLCLFTFRPIASKQLNGFSTIDTLSWLGGSVVTHPLWMQEVPGSIPGSGKDFYVWFFVLLLLCFYFFVQNTLFIAKYRKSFYNVNLFSILNILQDLWPIIRVKRYRPSIFNAFEFHGITIMDFDVCYSYMYHMFLCMCLFHFVVRQTLYVSYFYVIAFLFRFKCINTLGWHCKNDAGIKILYKIKQFKNGINMLNSKYNYVVWAVPLQKSTINNMTQLQL